MTSTKLDMSLRLLSYTLVLAAALGLTSCALPDDEYHLRLAEKHRLEGRRFLLDGKLVDAQTSLQKSLTEAKSVQRNRLPLALVESDLGELDFKQNKMPEARVHFLAAEKIFEEVATAQKTTIPPFWRDLTNVQDKLKETFEEEGNSADSSKVRTKILTQYRSWWRQAPDKHREIGTEYARMLDGELELALKEGRKDEASALLSEVSGAYADSAKDDPELQKSINMHTDMVAGRPVSEVPPVSKPVGQANQSSEESADKLDADGLALHQNGEFAQAEAKFRMALDLRIKSIETPPVKLAMAYEHLADSLLEQGKVEQTIPYYEKSASLKSNLKLTRGLGLDYCYHQLATVYTASNQRAKAEAAHLNNLQITKKLYGNTSAEAKRVESALNAFRAAK